MEDGFYWAYLDDRYVILCRHNNRVYATAYSLLQIVGLEYDYKSIKFLDSNIYLDAHNQLFCKTMEDLLPVIDKLNGILIAKKLMEA
jgi:hypothetical protein